MKFYRIEPRYDEEIGKTFPQSQHVISELHYDSPKHLRNLWGKLPEDVYIPDSILHPKAIVTDWISSSPIDYPIISEKLKRIFEKRRTIGVQYFHTQLIVKGAKLNYWLVNGYKNDYKYVDFNRSIINKVGIGRLKISALDIRSEAGFEVAIESITSHNPSESVWIERLELVEEIPDDLLFLNRVKGSNYYVSEKLKKEIEDSRCKGIQFVNMNVPYP